MPVKLYLSIKAVIVRDQKLMLVEKVGEHPPFWDMAGGRLDPGENIEQTLRREIAEELPSVKNYMIDELLHAEKKPGYSLDGTEIAFLYYRVKTEDHIDQISSEHSRWQWFTIDQLMHLDQPLIGVPGPMYATVLQKALALTPRL